MEKILSATVTFDLDEFEKIRREHQRNHEDAMTRQCETGKLSNPDYTEAVVVIAGTPISLILGTETVFASGYRRVTLARNAGDLHRSLHGTSLELPDQFDIGVVLMYGPDEGWIAAQGVAVTDESELLDEWPRQLVLEIEKMRPSVD